MLLFEIKVYACKYVRGVKMNRSAYWLACFKKKSIILSRCEIKQNILIYELLVRRLTN